MKGRSIAILAAGSLLLCTLPGSAAALTRAHTADGVAFATGGVSIGEMQALVDTKDDYALWVTTAAQGSGAFLSDVALRIRDRKTDALVLDTTMTGPWLFVDLPPGAYSIEAKFGDQVQRYRTRIEPGARHQVVLYFDSAARVSPDWKSPFGKSPYSID